MIAALIAILVIVVLVVIFIGKNLENNCAIWFFKDFGETNIVIVVFIAFAAGIITSLLLLLIGKCVSKAKSIKNEREKSENAEKDSMSVKKEEKQKATDKEIIDDKKSKVKNKSENTDNSNNE